MLTRSVEVFDVMVDGVLCIDTGHLERQTMGDAGLKAEILGLYQRQARLALLRLTSACSAEEGRDIAHSIKGASLGIGAWRVAQAATQLEQDARTLSHDRLSTAAVRDAIEDTLVTIETMI
jgi:HPt (histidine-containing phosphotransfer) domain-containing protein